ncbi:capping protein, Arp2/3 and myosin-I linker protein 2 isoform X2 [Hemicordylus capensis]|uniref:capping protein, Arp2/3 and myosin-I linker protein 2 isoform X2 n=1 Tax=Hemicordylus capensis TaxID=884348 RepID=UPI0023021620|nr:capping protein, Arp2/3 and myosin-I linker protein 2 isoform X2 [Hemicordylus capensis]
MAASDKEISAELYDSIIDFLGTHDVVLRAAQLHLKSKVEDVVLVLMPWRVLVLMAKVPVKLQVSFSFLAVHTIRIRETTQVIIETDASAYEFTFLSLDDLEYVVIHVVMSLKKVFPDTSVGTLLQNASPNFAEKIQGITNALEEVLKGSQAPCGGFSETYAALCDYRGLPFREEIQWDVDNIYHNQRCKEFNLLDFSYLHSQDVALCVTTLSYNQWFTRLCCKDYKLNPDVLEQILHVLSKSVILEELVLENCGLKFDFAQQMAQVLSDHPDSTLSTINLSGNQLEDRGIIALSQSFEKHSKKLESLNFARTSLSLKGATALCKSLVCNGLFKTSLCHLDLSGNPGTLATEDASGLLSFLSQPNALGHLDLSGTDCALDVVFGALANGCCGKLVHLNLSKNIYSRKKNRDFPFAICKFFSKASVLQHISLAGTKLPPEALRAVLQGLAYNTQLSDLHLDISSCELKSAGAQVIQDLVSDASSIGDLNLSDNGFDSDMVTLVLAISRSRSIRRVALGRNFDIRSRETLVDILHRIVQLTQDDDCPVESLSVVESRLKLGTGILLDSLGSPSSRLVMLDISGNAMGDLGAKILAKALSVNTTLRTLIWDRNNTTVCGFLDMACALERNFTLKTMPLPVTDVSQAYRSNPEKMEEIVHKMQSYLMRNQKQEILPRERFQLQPDTTTGSSEEAVKDMCQSMQKYIEVLSSVQDVEVKADIHQAEEAIKDAVLSISILPFLCETGSTPYQNGKLQHTLQSLIEEVSRTCSREIQAILEDTLDTAQSLCPQIFQKSGFRDYLVHNVSKKVLLDHLLPEVYGKLMGIQLSVTEAVAGGIIDKTLEELSTIQSKLARNFPKPTEELQVANDDWCALQQRCGSLKGVAEEEEGFQNEDVSVFQNEESETTGQWKHICSLSILPTPDINGLSEELGLKVAAADNKIGTPRAVLSLSCASAKKSRPASTKDAEAGSRRLPCTESASAQSLMDLPAAGEKLEHFTRDRPRPNRRNRQPPSKPNVQPPVRENDEDRSIARLDEGLDEFFTRKVIHEHLLPVPLEDPPAVATPISSGSRTFKKKIGHFFAFKKPKSTRSARPEKEPEGSPLAARGRKLMLSDILRAPSKASESTKALSKSEEGGLAVESRGHLEQSQTPDSARRARPKYSREGKSQSLILLSGEDEETLGVRHEKKRPFEKSDGELPSSFEQRVHVMLHRIGVTKVLSSEGKKKQNKDGEIKKAGSDGDIVDSSAESPPCSLKPRTHSMSTDPTVRIGPADAYGRPSTDPSSGAGEGRLSWKALGKQLNVELKGKCSELSSSPRRAFVVQEPASPREQKSRESWSSSLPRIRRSTAGPAPVRRTSNAEEVWAFSELQNSHADVNTIAGDNQLKPKPRLKPVANRRAMSVHEEQLRDQACAVELHHMKIPLCLQRSPILKWKIKPRPLLEPEMPAPSDSPGTPRQAKNTAATESKPRAETAEELQQALEQTLENTQNTALDQRTAVLLPKSPMQEH